jgi:hypothetical protein
MTVSNGHLRGKMERKKNQFSSQNQPSGRAKAQGKAKKFLIKNFRADFFEELINLKHSDGEMTRGKMLKQLARAIGCDDGKFLLANDRAKLILHIIEVLSPKDFDITDFNSRLKIYLGDEQHPIERELLGATDGETD